MEYIDTSAKGDVNVIYAFGKAIEMAEQAVYRSRRPDTQHPDVAPDPEPEEPRSRSRASTWSTADVSLPRLCVFVCLICNESESVTLEILHFLPCRVARRSS
jgi:hypothetical protein